MQIHIPLLSLLLLTQLLPSGRSPSHFVDEVVDYYPGGELQRRYHINAEGQKHGAYMEYAVDGMLRLNEIFRMRLAADLVVLSGCRTGLGELVRGEGMVGFTRALFYAGARSVIVSLWNVNDRSTAALMEAMYGRLVRGEFPSAALRQAKLAMIRSENPAFRHPSRWAPFILAGDPGRPREPVRGE